MEWQVHVPLRQTASNHITYNIFNKLRGLKEFQDVGLTFTTGKIQWDLYSDELSAKQTSKSTRLIWAENIQRYFIGEVKNRGDKLFINARLQNCEPINTDTIIVQRVTAVEQPWRIIATIVSPKQFGNPIQAENHTSYLETNQNKVDLRLILGLMNSSLMDFIFRHTNSNTQVSAGELNELPFPNRQEALEPRIIHLVDRILAAKRADVHADTRELEREIDELVYGLYGLTAEEIGVVEGGRRLDHETHER